MAERIPIKEIVILRAEGPTAECYESKHPSFQHAEMRLVQSAKTAPKGGAYDKHDVKLEWEDGSKFMFRFDVHNIEDEYPNLARALIRELEFYTGRWKPAKWTEAQALGIRSRIKAEARALMEHLLDKCQIGY